MSFIENPQVNLDAVMINSLSNQIQSNTDFRGSGYYYNKSQNSKSHPQNNNQHPLLNSLPSKSPQLPTFQLDVTSAPFIPKHKKLFE